jgi:hypothetical protein
MHSSPYREGWVIILRSCICVFRGLLRSWVHDGAQMLGRAVAECRLEPWIFKLLLHWQLDWCS